MNEAVLLGHKIIDKYGEALEEVVAARLDLPLLALNYDIELRRLQVGLIYNHVCVQMFWRKLEALKELRRYQACWASSRNDGM